jgi:hypothetical protein
MTPDDDDGTLVERVAREMLDRLGANKARKECRDWAKSAGAAGNTLTVEAWRDIADAIGRLKLR